MTISNPSNLSSLEHTFDFQGQTFLVESREDALARRAAAERTAIPDANHPLDQPSPASFSLLQYQSPLRGQGDRGTCWAFAGAAALEAAYKRAYNIDIVLSTQYIFQLGKVQELVYDSMSPARTHENNSTLWGFQGSSDVIEKMVRSAVCLETEAPYLSQSQMIAIQQTIPAASSITAPGADPSQAVMDAFELSPALIPNAARAKCIYGVSGYALGGTASSSAFEAIISRDHEVVVSIVLDFSPDQNGVWQYDASVQGGGHVILLIGYDRTAQTFTAKNPWGSYIVVSYDFIQRCASGYHYISEVLDPKRGPSKRAFWMGQWNMDYDGWRGQLNIRRHTNYRDTLDGPTRLGSYTRDGQTYDVNGHFEGDDQHCVLYIAPTTDRVTPGTEVGQRFDLYCFSWDDTLAAGTTTSDNNTYGALLSRNVLPAFVKKTFSPVDWVGDYAMNYDGWTGTLKIDAIAPFSAVFVQDSTSTHPVSGAVDGSKLTIAIAFPGNTQPFTLYHHTWEIGVFSGTTIDGGKTYGVVGFAKQH